MTREVVESSLRRLRDVLYVGFTERGASVVVQVVPAEGSDVAALRRDVLQICEAHLDVPFTLDLGGADRPARVRLLGVDRTDSAEVVVHLAYHGLCQSGRRAGSNPPSAAAEATFAALSQLGAPVPFRVEAAATFEHGVGEGVMVVLNSDADGPLFGVAAGPDPAHAGARATLHALNRYLATHAGASPLLR